MNSRETFLKSRMRAYYHPNITNVIKKLFIENHEVKVKFFEQTIKEGDLDLLKHLHEQYGIPIPLDQEFTIEIAKTGDEGMIKWLFKMDLLNKTRTFQGVFYGKRYSLFKYLLSLTKTHKYTFIDYGLLTRILRECPDIDLIKQLINTCDDIVDEKFCFTIIEFRRKEIINLLLKIPKFTTILSQCMEKNEVYFKTLFRDERQVNDFFTENQF